MAMTINGLASGLDTSSMINELMQAERAPQDQLKTKLTTEQSRLTAYRSINAKMSTLMSAAQALTSNGALDAVAAKSSTDSVTATALPWAKPGTLSFTVQQTAAAQVDMSGSLSGLSAQVTSGPVGITVGGTTTNLTPSDGSLQSLVSEINKQSGLGVSAAAVNMGDGTYRLQLTSAKSGAANGFSITGLDAAVGLSTKVPAQDAKITLAGDSTAVVSSSSNTFDQVIPGVSFSVKDGTTAGTAATVSMASDVDGIGKKVQALVDAANGALSEIATDTAYDPDKKTAAALTSDYSAREIQQKILSAVSTAVGGGTNADVGVTLTKDGKLAFDSAKFAKTYAANPDMLKKLTGVSGTSSSAGTTFYGGTQRTQAGTYQVQVDSLGSQATTTEAFSTGTWNLTVGGTTISASAADADSLVKSLAQQSSTKGLGLSFSNVGGSVKVTSTAYGSSQSFSLDPGTGTATSHAGTDVQGKIGFTKADGTTSWSATSGQGQLLNVSDISGPAQGLKITATATGASTITVVPGLGQKMANVASATTDSATGTLTSAINSENSVITGLNTGISDWDTRLSGRQDQLTTMFANMESALSKLQSQQSWLASAIAGM